MTHDDPPPEFISEPIEPERGSFDASRMAQGLAGLPGAFRWRGRRYAIVELLDYEKKSQAEGHTPDGERYLRREEYTVRLDTGHVARLYVTRQAARGARRAAARRRWFLYTITAPDRDEG